VKQSTGVLMLGASGAESRAILNRLSRAFAWRPPIWHADDCRIFCLPLCPHHNGRAQFRPPPPTIAQRAIIKHEARRPPARRRRPPKSLRHPGRRAQRPLWCRQSTVDFGRHRRRCRRNRAAGPVDLIEFILSCPGACGRLVIGAGQGPSRGPSTGRRAGR
jgi:hypothetical protein